MTLSIYSWLDSMEYWRVGILTNGYDGQGVVARFEYQSINQNVIPGTQSGQILTIEILCKQRTKILVTLIGQGFFHGYIELTIMSPAMSASYFYRHFWLKNILFPKLIFPLPTSSLGFFSLIWQHQRTLKYAICNELLSSEKHRCYDDDLRRYMKMLMMSR